MNYYINPFFYGYMYYPYNYYSGYAPFYPVSAPCSSCKNNAAYWGTHNRYSFRNQNNIPMNNGEVELQEQKFIPGEFSISYPFIPKKPPMTGGQPPMQGPVGGPGQGGPGGPMQPGAPGGPGQGGPGGPMQPGVPGGPGGPMQPGVPGGPGQGGPGGPMQPGVPGGPGQGGPGGPMQPGGPSGQGTQGNQGPGNQGQGGVPTPRQQNLQGREEIIDSLNEAIADKVAGLFKSQVLLPEQVDFAEVYGTYEDTLNKNGIVSILFDMYTYVNKAAHGLSVYDSITFNANTGQIYSFSDLFNPRVNYMAELNRLAQEYINRNNVPLLENFKGIDEDQSFYLTSDSLVMYYQVYRYTPYYYGLFKIEIPYSRIRNLLGPLSPINQLI